MTPKRKQEFLEECKKTKIKVNLLNLVFFGIGIYKIIIVLLQNTYLIFGGVSTLLFCIAKIFISYNLTREDVEYKKINKHISFWFVLSGIAYALSMGYVLFGPDDVKEYELWVGIVCIVFALVEGFLTIREIVLSESYGRYFRDLRTIDLFECMEASILALIALSITLGVDLHTITIYAGSAGFSIGILEILVAIFLLFVPKFSVIDEPSYFVSAPEHLRKKSINVVVVKSRFLGNLTFEGTTKHRVLYGTFVDNEPKPFSKPVSIFLWLTSYVRFIPYLILSAIYFIQTLFARKTLLKILNKKDFSNEEVKEI